MRFTSLAAGLLAAASLAGPAAAFSARSPTDVFQVVTTGGASGVWAKNDNGKGTDYIKAKTGKVPFDVDFFRCNDARSDCGLTIYQLAFASEVTQDQLNGWNKWTTLCPAYHTESGNVRMWMAVLAPQSATRADVAAQVDEWLGCVKNFDAFTDDPGAFLEAHN